MKIFSIKSRKLIPIRDAAIMTGILSQKRFEKMAYFRNRCLQHVRDKYANWDYMMVVDLDISGPISIDGLATCFFYNGWDSMSAYGLATCFFYNGLSPKLEGLTLTQKYSIFYNRILQKYSSHQKQLCYYDSLALVNMGEKPPKISYINTLLYTLKTHMSSCVPELQKCKAFRSSLRR